MRRNNVDYEKDLLLRLINDDEDAFSSLYILYKVRVVAFIYTFTKSKEMAEDVAHDTFAVIWKNRHFINIDLSFSSFVFTIAKNRILYLLRNQAKEEEIREVILSKAIDYYDTTSETVSENELKRVLDIAVSKLTKRQKEVFELSREYSFTQKEIAEKLDISVYTVQEHIASALKIIQSTLNTYYGKHLSFIFLITLPWVK